MYERKLHDMKDSMFAKIAAKGLKRTNDIRKKYGQEPKIVDEYHPPLYYPKEFRRKVKIEYNKIKRKGYD